MSHYAKVVDYPDGSWPEATEINWENFFQPPTPFEVYLFQTSLPKPDESFNIPRAIETLCKLNDYRKMLPNFFEGKDGSDVLPPGVSTPVLIHSFYKNKPVHFQDGGYLNHKNVRLALAGAQFSFYFTIENNLKYWLKIAHSNLNPSRILDIGCGNATTTFQYGELFPNAEVIGIDLSPPFVRACREWKNRRKAENVNFYQANAESTHWPDGYFDIIHFTYVLHEMPRANAKKILKEILRLLKTSGILSVMDVRYGEKEERENTVKRGTFGKFGCLAQKIIGFHGPEPFMNEYMELCLPAAITDTKISDEKKQFINFHQYYSKDGDGFFGVAEVGATTVCNFL